MLPTNGASQGGNNLLLSSRNAAPIAPVDLFAGVREGQRLLAQLHMALQQNDDPQQRARNLQQLQHHRTHAPSARLRLQAQALQQLYQGSIPAVGATPPVPRPLLVDCVPPPRHTSDVPPLQQGAKRKRFASEVAALHAPNDLRFRELSLDHARQASFYFTSTYRAGKFGKFVLACSADGYACGAKIFRTPDSSKKVGSNSHGRPYTVAMPAAAIDHELRAQFDAGSLAIYANVQLPNNKRMLILERSNGTIQDVLADLDASQRYALATETLRAVSVRLKHVHDAGYMHRDIKLDNIHWKTDGSLHLGDFGSAIKAAEVQGMDVRGTYPAPRMFAGSRYDRRVDFYAFGLSVASILVPDVPNPLLRLNDDNALVRMKTRADAFFLWAHRWLDQPWPQPFCSTKAQNAFYPFFFRLRERAPTLHDFILREMLLSLKSAGAMARSVQQFSVQLQTLNSAADWAETLGRLQELAREGHAERWLRALQAFRTWRLQAAESSRAPARGAASGYLVQV